MEKQLATGNNRMWRITKVRKSGWLQEPDIAKHPGIRSHLQEGEIRFADRH